MANLSSKSIIVLDNNLHNPYFPGFFNNLEAKFSKLKLDMSVFFEVQKEAKRVYLIHDKHIGEELKRYAFFYFHSVAFFLKSYFKYLSFSVNLSLKETLSAEQVYPFIEEIKKRNDFLKEEISKMEGLLNNYEGKGIFATTIKKINSGIAILRKEYEENSKKIGKFNI